MQQEKRRQEKLQLQLAGDFVDHVIGSVFLGLDVYLAGLHANLVGSAVIGLGAVNDIGHVILLAAELHIQLRCKRGTAAACRGLGRFTVLDSLASAAGASTAGAAAAVFFFSGIDKPLLDRIWMLHRGLHSIGSMKYIIYIISF